MKKLNKKSFNKAHEEYMENLYLLDFQRTLQTALAKYYSDELGRRIKRGKAEAKRRKNEQDK